MSRGVRLFLAAALVALCFLGAVLLSGVAFYAGNRAASVSLAAGATVLLLVGLAWLDYIREV